MQEVTTALIGDNIIINTMKNIGKVLVQEQKLNTNVECSLDAKPIQRGGEEIAPGTLHGGEEIKPGTLHGGEEIAPGTLH